MIKTDKDEPRREDLPPPLGYAARGSVGGQDLASLPAPINAGRLRQKIETWNEQVSREGWSVQIPHDFPERFALQRGYELLQNSGPVIIGMSLGNSYFSTENITRLFRFLRSLNVEIYIVVMDKPSEHNYRALGYSESRIAEKIKKKGAEIFRAIRAALGQVDIPGECFHVLSWDTIREHKGYQPARQTLEMLYLRNEAFRKDLRSAVNAYLTPKLEGATMTEERYVRNRTADTYFCS